MHKRYHRTNTTDAYMYTIIGTFKGTGYYDVYASRMITCTCKNVKYIK